MYFIHNSDNEVYSCMTLTGRFRFEKFSTLDDSIQVAIFSNEVEAVSCANMIQRESKHICGILQLSELESFLLKRV